MPGDQNIALDLTVMAMFIAMVAYMGAKIYANGVKYSDARGGYTKLMSPVLGFVCPDGMRMVRFKDRSWCVTTEPNNKVIVFPDGTFASVESPGSDRWNAMVHSPERFREKIDDGITCYVDTESPAPP